MTDDRVQYLQCSACEAKVFVQVVAVQRVSALRSATGKEMNVPRVAGYSCAMCGMLTLQAPDGSLQPTGIQGGKEKSDGPAEG